MIPVDVLVGELAVAKVDDDDQRALDALAGGSDAGKHPVHFNGVGKFENHFVNEPLGADGSGDGNDLRVGRHLGDEVLRVEFAQLVAADAAGQDGDVVDVGVGHHGIERGFGVAGGEFVAEVLLPKVGERLLRGSQAGGGAGLVGHAQGLSV